VDSVEPTIDVPRPNNRLALAARKFKECQREQCAAWEHRWVKDVPPQYLIESDFFPI
jgi:hypothetical protein